MNICSLLYIKNTYKRTAQKTESTKGDLIAKSDYFYRTLEEWEI